MLQILHLIGSNCLPSHKILSTTRSLKWSLPLIFCSKSFTYLHFLGHPILLDVITLTMLCESAVYGASIYAILSILKIQIFWYMSLCQLSVKTVISQKTRIFISTAMTAPKLYPSCYFLFHTPKYSPQYFVLNDLLPCD
jgi:hypothetical protein